MEDMWSERFEDQLLRPLRGHLRSPGLTVTSKLPAAPDGRPAWDCVHEDGRAEIRLVVPVAALCENLQTDEAAAPSFALCLAVWLEHMTGAPCGVYVQIVGCPPPEGSNELLHFRRSTFLLAEYQALLPETFRVSAAEECRWQWPECPTFHVEGPRRNRKMPKKGEDLVARKMALSPQLVASFSEHVEPVRWFQDKLPMGLFQRKVANANRWTVAGPSAVDLWAQSASRAQVHLFELKLAGNQPVGILPEAFYYARMASYVRTRRGIDFALRGQGLSAVRAASQLFMWLSGPGYHPLVWATHLGHSAPLARLNRSLRRHKLTLGILPLAPEADPPELVYRQRWQVAEGR